RFYVVDAVGEGLLVVQTRPAPRVTRRVALPGGPYAAAVEPDRHDLYVTLTARNEVVRLPAHSRPFVDARFPAVQAPRAIAVTSGAVLVRGAAATQILAPRDPDGERDR
ncbi:MAG TPA: hypothetical protein VD931_10635, partial [Baekduia sp.]|nr:hypothetical protein [Baekduia sp.]